MKKIFVIAGLALLISCLSSCLRTLHPIFTTKDIVYEPKLTGTWKTDNQGTKGLAVITNLAADNSIELPEKISAIKQKGYLVAYKDEDGNTTGQYIAFLARIGKHLYFDYYPADKKDNESGDEFFMWHFVKMHTSFRVDISTTGNFELSQLDDSYVIRLIEEKKIRISHEKRADDDMVITASTDELQQYIIKYGDEPGAYRSEKTVFTK